MKKNESLALAKLARQALLEKKAVDAIVLDVRKLSSVTDFYLIATGTSAPHLKAMGEELNDQLRTASVARRRSSGEANSGRVSVITAASNSVSSCVTVGQFPVWIAASSDGSKVYVPHQGVNLTVSPKVIPGTTVIRTSNNLVINDLPAPAANSETCIANPAACNYMIPFFVVASK